MKKYALLLHSTMIDSTTYILFDNKDDVGKAFKMFNDFLYEGITEPWENLCSNYELLFNDEDINYSYMVGTLENGNNVIIVYDYYGNKEMNTYEFEIVTTYNERF